MPTGRYAAGHAGSSGICRSTDSQFVARAVAASMPETSNATDSPGSRASASGAASSTTGAALEGSTAVAVTVTVVRTSWTSSWCGAESAHSGTAGIASRPVFVIRTVTPVPSGAGSTATPTARSPQMRTSAPGIAIRSARGRAAPLTSTIVTWSR